MTERELKFRKAFKDIATQALSEIDQAEDLEVFVDGIIGALLGMKIFLKEKV